MYKIRKILSVIIILALISSVLVFVNSCDKFDEDEVIYRILQMTDPQFALRFEHEPNSVESMRNLINMTNPDLIVITGDLCGTPRNYGYNDLIYQDYVAFLDSFSIPYAIVFGNHDHEGRATKQELADILKTGEYSLFEEGPDITGIGNYIVNVPHPKGGIAWSLFMIDSNEYLDDGYDYIRQDQIEWYRHSVLSMKEENNGVLNSLAFFHIPLPEYGIAWNLRDTDEVIHHFGSRREIECPSLINSGLFDLAKELNSTKGFFVGHDHINDYSLTYQGIRLTYGLKTAYGSYGKKDLRGGLLISLTSKDFIVEQIFCN